MAHRRPRAGRDRPDPREDGRLYVDDPQGTATTIVEPDGSATTVTTGGTSSAASPGLSRRSPPAAHLPARTPAAARRRPPAPTAVAVKRQGDVLTVSSRATASVVDHYTVVLDRAVATTTTATSATLRSTVDRPVRVAVSATDAAGTGPLSAAVTASAAVVRPAAPVGLTLAADAGRPSAFAPSWTAPDLGGGDLVRYEAGLISATGDPDNPDDHRDVAAPGHRRPCAAPYTVSVRAVTRTPGRRLLTGPPTTATSATPVRERSPSGWPWRRTPTATTRSPSPRPTAAGRPAVHAERRGEIRWSGTCGDRARMRIAVGGLDSKTSTPWC